MRRGWGGAGRGGSKKCKPIPAPPLDAGLKSCPIPAPPPLRGGENPHGAKRGGAGQAGRGKIAIPSFNLWCLLLIMALYHQTNTPISFWCKRGLNPRYLIQQSETLPIELTRTHNTVSV